MLDKIKEIEKEEVEIKVLDEVFLSEFKVGKKNFNLFEKNIIVYNNQIKAGISINKNNGNIQLSKETVKRIKTLVEKVINEETEKQIVKDYQITNQKKINSIKNKIRLAVKPFIFAINNKTKKEIEKTLINEYKNQ